MRSISVSTDVFQAIWSARKSDEHSEDDILRRLLKVSSAKLESPPTKFETKGAGWTDARYGTHFAEGFEVFRTYKGRQFKACVSNGLWRINGQAIIADTMNKLSASIGIKGENAWENWSYLTPSGCREKVSELRDPSKIHRRSSIDYAELASKIQIDI